MCKMRYKCYCIEVSNGKERDTQTASDSGQDNGHQNQKTSTACLERTETKQSHAKKKHKRHCVSASAAVLGLCFLAGVMNASGSSITVASSPPGDALHAHTQTNNGDYADDSTQNIHCDSLWKDDHSGKRDCSDCLRACRDQGRRWWQRQQRCLRLSRPAGTSNKSPAEPHAGKTTYFLIPR